MFHFIQAGNRTSFWRGHLINLSLGMSICMQQEICSTFGGLNSHFQCVMCMKAYFNPTLGCCTYSTQKKCNPTGAERCRRGHQVLVDDHNRSDRLKHFLYLL